MQTSATQRSEKGTYSANPVTPWPTSDNRSYVRFGFDFPRRIGTFQKRTPTPSSTHHCSLVDESGMSHHQSDDDDDLENDDSENETTVPCPECGSAIFLIADACPACGYWLSEDDRRTLDRKSAKPAWLTITTWVLIAVFLVGILGVAGFLF